MKLLSDYIMLFDNVMPVEICNEIIQMYENTDSTAKTMYREEGYTFERLEMDYNFCQGYANKILPYFEHYLNKVGMTEMLGIQAFEGVRINKYRKNSEDHFKTHIDSISAQTAMRYLYCLLYLNDNNGNTEFPTLGITVIPKAGTMLMFPPLWLYPHKALNPTDNDKYVLMTNLQFKN